MKGEDMSSVKQLDTSPTITSPTKLTGTDQVVYQKSYPSDEFIIHRPTGSYWSDEHYGQQASSTQMCKANTEYNQQQHQSEVPLNIGFNQTVNQRIDEQTDFAATTLIHLNPNHQHQHHHSHLHYHVPVAEVSKRQQEELPLHRNQLDFYHNHFHNQHYNGSHHHDYNQPRFVDSRLSNDATMYDSLSHMSHHQPCMQATSANKSQQIPIENMFTDQPTYSPSVVQSLNQIHYQHQHQHQHLHHMNEQNQLSPSLNYNCNQTSAYCGNFTLTNQYHPAPQSQISEHYPHVCKNNQYATDNRNYYMHQQSSVGANSQMYQQSQQRHFLSTNQNLEHQNTTIGTNHSRLSAAGYNLEQDYIIEHRNQTQIGLQQVLDQPVLPRSKIRDAKKLAIPKQTVSQIVSDDLQTINRQQLGETTYNNYLDNNFVQHSQAIKTNQCHICNRHYARPSTLKTHLRTHTNERPYKCIVCFKTFSQAANLTAHQRVHTGERPFPCPICGRQFSQSSSVITHLRTHSGERPYRCSMCHRTFSDSSTLTKHCRIHSGEKPYQCEYCPLNFSQSGNLSRHLRLHLMGSIKTSSGVSSMAQNLMPNSSQIQQQRTDSPRTINKKPSTSLSASNGAGVTESNSALSASSSSLSSSASSSSEN